MKFSTKAIHKGYKRNKQDGAIIPPIHLTTTFEFGNEGGNYEGDKALRYGNGGEYDYARTINPTRYNLEETMAALDNTKFGLAYSSGSAVLANVVTLLEPNETILFSSDAYGGTYRFIVNVAGRQGIKYRITDLTDMKQTEKELKSGNIKLVWVETPTNPLLKVTDIQQLAELSHRYGALLIVDNTFATPVLQQPAALGADMVAYSTTKYINGHSDSIGGGLTLNDDVLFKRLKFLQNSIGAIMSPFDAWLTLRGLKTLEVRMQRHVDNAESIAHFLNDHPKIAKVYYPGLFTGEQGKIVEKQMNRPGAMISIELGEQYDVKKFIKSLRYFPLAESLGGIESLLDHPVTMTHGAIPPAERKKIGLSDTLLRISVGIENEEDLLKDLKQALKKA